MNNVPKLHKGQWLIISLIVLIAIIKFYFPNMYAVLLESYLNLLAETASMILNSTGINHTYIGQTFQTAIDQKLEINTVFLSLKLNALLLFILTSVNKEKLYYTYLYVVWAIGINILRIALIVFLLHHNVLSDYFLHHYLYMSLLCLFPLLNVISKTIIQKGSKGFENSILKLLIVLYVFYTVGFTIQLFYPEFTETLYTLFADSVLQLSNSSLNFLGYESAVFQRKIFDTNTYIYLADPCVGINILTVFSGILLISERLNIKALLYILLGSGLIVGINSFRITYLFIYLKEKGTKDGLFELHHEIYNWFIYLTIFVLWYVWFFIIKSDRQK